jgi:hypothetical protein
VTMCLKLEWIIWYWTLVWHTAVRGNCNRFRALAGSLSKTQWHLLQHLVALSTYTTDPHTFPRPQKSWNKSAVMRQCDFNVFLTQPGDCT